MIHGSRTAELTQEDLQLVAATVAMMGRLMSPGLAQHFAAQFLSSEPSFTDAEIEVLCAALGAMSKQIGKDRRVPPTQVKLIQYRAAVIIQKLERGIKG